MESSVEHRVRLDALLAATLACGLTLIWSFRSWSDLSALRLPDPDDMLRLQQIRDWLGGQAFGDLTQYRLGRAGVPMHWSRVPDLIPAFFIWALEGPFGRQTAEVSAVIIWPTSLLFSALWLVGNITRQVAGEQAVWRAMAVTAAAFPAITAFAPGRIDHHGLQLVLILIATTSLLKAPTAITGAVMGAAMVLSVVTGMEMAPLLVVMASAGLGEWILCKPGAEHRLLGLGTSLLVGTFLSSLGFHSSGWDYPACDGFNALSAHGMLLSSLALLILGLTPASEVRLRTAVALVMAVSLAIAIMIVSPQCLSPYGQVSPTLTELWLGRVTEAQSIATAPIAVVIAHCGLMFAGLFATVYRVFETRARSWFILLILQMAAVAVALVQLRGSLAGALLAAPALGSMLTSASRCGAKATITAWLVSGGLFYPVAAQAVPARSKSEPQRQFSSCTASDLMLALDHLDPGSVMAPIDTAAPLILSTQHRAIAGAYHRDGAGILAMYAFFSTNPENAKRLAISWRVRWVVVCAGFGDLDPPFARSLEEGRVPHWLVPVAQVTSGARIFEVRIPNLHPAVGN